MNVLFVCSKNQWRSPTAERIYARHPAIAVRSAGVARSARHQVTQADIHWADLILVMEDKHLRRLRADFSDELRGKRCCVLGIPDEYRFMDPELVEELRSAVDPILEADD
ncbi:MAG: phosphotyrosine protein phosphatase [Planctomycetota bacterium]|jgi:predicted protein tyrosine phosphatase|nr:phosphotyrosine protein phosphatase [Planctomycetota bacterium]